MSGALLSSDAKLAMRGYSRENVLRRFGFGDSAFRILTQTCAIAVLVLLGGVIVSLAYGSAPAFRQFGLGFLASESWNPVTEKFGALAPIYGTLVTSLI